MFPWFMFWESGSFKMLMLQKVREIHHCLCVRKCIGRGKNSPLSLGADKGAASEDLEESLHKARGKRQGKEVLLCFLDVVGVSMLDESRWLNSNLKGGRILVPFYTLFLLASHGAFKKGPLVEWREYTDLFFWPPVFKWKMPASFQK